MTLRTFTVDTASTPWVYSNGLSTTVNGTSETFQLDFTDTGAGGVYFGGGESVLALTDGKSLTIEQNPTLTYLNHGADGAVANSGSIWVRVNGGIREEVKVVTATFTDGDGTGANNLASITFEYPGKPYRWTWTNVDMA